jgi:hypothetical protein
MQASARSVDEYIASLPDDRRSALATVRDVVRANLPGGFEEGMQHGMIGWYVPLSRYPDTYNGEPLCMAGLASQKGYMSLYLIAVYTDDEMRRRFEDEYRRSGKKLDMGKSCVRFKSLDDLPLDVVGRVIAALDVDEFIARIEALHGSPSSRRATKVRGAGRKTGPSRRAKH